MLRYSMKAADMSGETELTLVPTKCTHICLNKHPPFQAFVHSSDGARLPVAPKHHKPAQKRIPEKDDRPELEMKRVRYEIMKFGRSGLEGREREEADVELAVSLGAVPPKRKCINYKDLIQKKQEMKEAEKAQIHSVVKLKTTMKKGKEKKVKGKDKNVKKSILKSYGKPTPGNGGKIISKEKRRK